MREILFKNLTNSDQRRHDFCIREVIKRDDCMATIERRCMYFVRECTYVEDPSDMSKLESMKGDGEAWKKKHFHILRNHDSNTGADRLICKVAGTLYAVAGHYVFCVAFVHSFKIDLLQDVVKGKKA